MIQVRYALARSRRRIAVQLPRLRDFDWWQFCLMATPLVGLHQGCLGIFASVFWHGIATRLTVSIPLGSWDAVYCKDLSRMRIE